MILKNFSIRKKIFIQYVVTAIMLCIIIFVPQFILKDIEKTYQNELNNFNDLQYQMYMIDSNLKLFISESITFAIDNKQNLEVLEQNYKKLQKNIEKLKKDIKKY